MVLNSSVITNSLRYSPLLLSTPQRCLTNVKEAPYKRPNPPRIDYLTFGPLLSLFDRQNPRMNENTKMMVVAGSVLSGKGHFASRIAEYFDLMYHPDITDDDIFCSKCPDGSLIDIRSHNVILPESARYYTTEMFWQDKDPIKKGKPLYLQFGYYTYRFFNYAKGLCHLFNTGRGQIFDRDVFSELIFAQAMYKCGLLSEYAYSWFEEMHNKTTMNLWRPHIIFYVKASNEQIKERIKQRSLEWEIDSSNLNDKFLDTYRDCLENHLELSSKYSEVVVINRRDVDIYDEDDIKIIVDKLPALDLKGENFNRDEPKFIDWRLGLHLKMATTTNRSRFSNARTMMEYTFGSFSTPLETNEAKYSATAAEYQVYLKNIDPRFRYKSEFNPLFQNWLNIMFNPFSVSRNFRRDHPKEILARL